MWDTLGNTSVLTDLFGDVFPSSQGGHYAFVSSGNGSLGGVLSGMVRDFNIPAGATKMKVRYNYVSQEYPSWVNTIYNDMFYILIGGERSFLHKETVNSNAGKWKNFYKEIGNVSESNAAHQGVLHLFGGETGMREVSFDIGRCSGQRTRMIFAVSDMGDSIYDSAALIDKVWFE